MKVKTAMIIDDDVDFTNLLANILEKRKIHVLVVHSLQEAEDYLAYLKPTIIFLDNSFPEGLGINFIHCIREVDEQIKIVMMTGDTAPWIYEKAVQEGTHYFLAKPVSMKTIDDVLDELKLDKVTEGPIL
ncbi:MAG: response regulator [Chitinophagaceae bacterium]